MSDSEEIELEDKFELPEGCGLGLRKYFYFIAGIAVVILAGTYWYIDHYSKNTGSADFFNGMGLTGNQPRAVNAPPATAQAPSAAPMNGNNIPANAQPFRQGQPMVQNIGGGGFASVAMAMRNSVVNISTTSGTSNLVAAKPAPGANKVRFANPFSPRSRGSIGSGVIIRNDGYIISNYHIVRGASAAVVTIFTNQGTQRYKADIVKMDEAMDLVLLKINPPTPLRAAVLGDSSQVRVADEVIAIGSPFGLDQTVSRGIVSALRKSLAIEGITHSDLIQTDAAINQGNSGGPLIAANGTVIAINTAIYTPTGAFSGIGFAIPSNQIRKFMRDEMGQPLQAPRGFTAAAQNGTAPVIRANASVPGNHRGDGRAGMACTSCHQFTGQAAGQPAAFQFVRAPNKPAPVIRANASPPGNHRNDGRVNMACTSCHQISGQPRRQQAGLQFAKPPTSLAMNVATPNNANTAFGVPGANYTLLGAGLMPISAALAERLNHAQDNGVFVSQVMAGSPSALAGLKAGDIILKIAGRRVWAPGQLAATVKEMITGEIVRLSVERGGQRTNLDLVVSTMPTAMATNPQSAIMTPRAIPNEFNWRGANIENFIMAKPPTLAGDPGARGAELDGVTKGSPAAKAGLRTRDIILKINSQSVGTPTLLDRAIRDAKGQTSNLLLVMRGGREFFVVLP